MPTNGVVSIDETEGYITYTPNADWCGTDTFTYTVQDEENVTSNEATVTVVVDCNPDPVDDVYTTMENMVLSGDVSTNDDLGDEPATVSAVTDVSNGILDLKSDGTFTYTPDPDFAGEDYFTYEVCDFNLDCAQADVYITVNSRNMRSIQVSLDDNLTGIDIGSTRLEGEFTIYNVSNNSKPVQILGMNIHVELRKGSKGGYSNLSVDLSDKYTFVPAAPFVIAGDGSETVTFTCEWTEISEDLLSIIEIGDTIKVTAFVEIFSAGKKAGHQFFKNSGSKFVESFDLL